MTETDAGSTPTSDWDPLDPAMMADAFPEYERMRSECPVAYSDRFDGFYMLNRREDILRAVLDHRTYASTRRSFVHFPQGDFIPLSINPPEQTKYRRRLNRYVAPERIKELELGVREDVIELLAPLLQAGGGDLAADLAGVIPTRALCRLLSMPRETWEHVQQVLEMISAGTVEMAVGETVSTDADSHLISEAELEINGAVEREVEKLVRARRSEPLDPEKDMISGMLADESIPEDVIAGVGALMFAAGADTTKYALASAFHFLATHPEEQDRLRLDPGLIEVAAEEILRFRPPLHHLARTTTADVEVAGLTLPAGSVVALNYASANFDSGTFQSPEKCLIDRAPNPHMTFGHGVHKCLGAPLARMEMRVAMEELLARTSSVTLAGDAVPTHEPFGTGHLAVPVALVATEAGV